MGKRNYAKAPKYKRRRARLLEVGELFGNAALSVPVLAPTEQIGIPLLSTSSIPSVADQNIGPLLDDDTDENDDDLLAMAGHDNQNSSLINQGLEPESPASLPPNTMDTFQPGNNVQLGMDLLDLCTETKVPLQTYDKIIRIFKKHCPIETDKKWWKSIPTRDKLLTLLKTKVPTVNPTLHQVTSDPHDILTKYPFLSQLLDLFSHPHFQEIESCCVNSDTESRFLKYQPADDEGLSDLVCGKWYEDTYDLRIGDQPLFHDPVSQQDYHNWLVPLKFYNDKTGVTAMEGSYSLEPLVFTVCVLRRHVLQSEDAWRHLGFIPSKTVKTRNGEESLAFTHQCLSILLEDLIHLQRNPPLVTLCLFGEEHRVRLVLEVACVLGDQVSQDTHCCRKQSNAGGAGRVHRSCLASYISGGPPQSEDGCIRLSKELVEDLCETVWCHENEEMRATTLLQFPAEEQQKKAAKLMDLRSKVARDILGSVLTMYPVKNAWSNVSFGSNYNGIYRATLDDPMHYNSSGLFSYLGEIAFKSLLPSEAKLVEQYLREDASDRSSNRCNLPKGKFSSGFTNCTLLTASEKVGLIHTLYHSLATKRVADIYKVSILRQQQKYLNFKCFQTTSLEKEVSEPILAKLIGDKYYFKAGPTVNKESVPMKRDLENIQDMLKRLNRIGMLKVVSDVIPHFDSLQTEYLLQILWDRLSQKNLTDLDGPPTLVMETVQATRLCRLSVYLSKQVMMPDVLPQKTSHLPPVIVIQRNLDKHCFDKPTVAGNGNTTAILTDVEGFRDVLEQALIYFSLVHEFHELPSHLQQDLPSLKTKIDQLLVNITNNIYRGDNSTDTFTCKIHAHYHITDDIKYFGPPIGYDASTGERNLKWWAKSISKTARKCGQAMFLEQTSKRVTDHRMLKRARNTVASARTGDISTDKIRNGVVNEGHWKYTRKLAHMRYNVISAVGYVIDFDIPANVSEDMLLTDQIRDVLRNDYNNEGEDVEAEIEIWRDITMPVVNGDDNI